MMTYALNVVTAGIILFALSSVAQAESETSHTLKFERKPYADQAMDGSSKFLFSAKKALSPHYPSDEKGTSFSLQGKTYDLIAKKVGDEVKITMSEVGGHGKAIFEDSRTSESLRDLSRDGITVDLNGIPLKLEASLSFNHIDTISYHVPEYGVAVAKLGNDKITTVAAFNKSGGGLTSPPDKSSKFLVDFNRDGLFESGTIEELELGESAKYFGYDYRLEADAEGNIVFITVKLPKEYAGNKSLWVIGEDIPEFTFIDETGKLRKSSDLKGKYTYLSIGRKPSVFFQTAPTANSAAIYSGRPNVPIISPDELKSVRGIENLECVHLEIPGKTFTVFGVKTGFEEVDKEFPTWTAEDWSQELTLFTLGSGTGWNSYGTNTGANSYHGSHFPAVHEVIIGPDGKLAALSVYNQKQLSLMNYLVKYRDVQLAIEAFHRQ